MKIDPLTGKRTMTIKEKKRIGAGLRRAHATRRAARSAPATTGLTNAGKRGPGRPRRTPPVFTPEVLQVSGAGHPASTADIEIVPGVRVSMNRAQVVQAIERLVNVLA